MNVETGPVCEHGITPLQLSAWRDGDLPDAEAARIAYHVADCLACRERLAAYDATARALHGQRVPRADDRLWRAVAARADGNTPARPRRGWSAFRPRPLWSGVAALVALALIVGSFAFAFSQRRGTPVQRPAHQPAPAGLQLTWTRATVPAGVALDSSTMFFGLGGASTNGNIAYACATPRDINGQPNPGDPGGKVHAWVTRDRAATWQPVANMPLARSDATGCALLVDDNNASTILVVVTWQVHPAYTADATQSAAFLSTDAGGSWSPLPVTATTIVDLSSAQNTLYALAWIPFTHGSGTRADLFASTDDLRTWHEIDTSLIATESPFQFAVRPDTGELLIQTTPGDLPAGRNITHLWFSSDGGQTWTQRPAPDAEQFHVAPVAAGQPWRLCGDNFEASANPDLPTALACSTDSGKTWHQRPVLQSTAADAEGGATPAPGSTPSGADNGQHLIVYAGVTASGDVLAADLYELTRLYRLAPNSDQWQYLGVVPGPNSSNSAITYVPVPGSNGVVWATIGAPSSGASGSSGAPLPATIYTAEYPGM